MIKINLLKPITIPNLMNSISRSTNYINDSFKYKNCGPRIQSHPRRKYYGLELRNTLYPSPRIYMENYNKFKHYYISDMSKRFFPKITFQIFPTQKTEKITYRNKYHSISTGHTKTKVTSSIEIQTSKNNDINYKLKSKKIHNLRKINLNFPYVKPTKSNLDNFFLEIEKKKKIKVTPYSFKTFS